MGNSFIDVEKETVSLIKIKVTEMYDHESHKNLIRLSVRCGKTKDPINTVYVYSQTSLKGKFLEVIKNQSQYDIYLYYRMPMKDFKKAMINLIKKLPE